MDPRVKKVAEVLIKYSVAIKPADLVMIHLYDPLAEPLALAVYEEVVKAGGNTVFNMAPTGADVYADELLLKYGSDEQLDFTHPVFQWMMDNIDVRIALRAPSNTKALSNVSPDRLARFQRSLAPISEAFMQRQGTGELRWTLTQFPTQAGAQDAEMSLSEYQDFIFEAAMVHLDDPVSYWKQKSQEQQRLIDWLTGHDRVEVRGENVDLTLSIKGRTFVNADGKRNFPDGEIYTGPVEESVNGWVRYTYPAIRNAREVVGVELQFEDGKVIKATASKGEEFLNSVLDTDAGARYVGEFAIGTNEGIQQFTRNTLFDEKIGGTFHMALGAGYPNTGSKSKSAIHWDMICDMRSGGEIIVDGELFYQNGEFKI